MWKNWCCKTGRESCCCCARPTLPGLIVPNAHARSSPLAQSRQDCVDLFLVASCAGTCACLSMSRPGSPSVWVALVKAELCAATRTCTHTHACVYICSCTHTSIHILKVFHPRHVYTLREGRLWDFTVRIEMHMRLLSKVFHPPTPHPPTHMRAPCLKGDCGTAAPGATFGPWRAMSSKCLRLTSRPTATKSCRVPMTTKQRWGRAAMLPRPARVHALLLHTDVARQAQPSVPPHLCFGHVLACPGETPACSLWGCGASRQAVVHITAPFPHFGHKNKGKLLCATQPLSREFGPWGGLAAASCRLKSQPAMSFNKHLQGLIWWEDQTEAGQEECTRGTSAHGRAMHCNPGITSLKCTERPV